MSDMSILNSFIMLYINKIPTKSSITNRYYLKLDFILQSKQNASRTIQWERINSIFPVVRFLVLFFVVAGVLP